MRVCVLCVFSRPYNWQQAPDVRLQKQSESSHAHTDTSGTVTCLTKRGGAARTLQQLRRLCWTFWATPAACPATEDGATSTGVGVASAWVRLIGGIMYYICCAARLFRTAYPGLHKGIWVATMLVFYTRMYKDGWMGYISP